jgi:tartrate-resistant acid phosphatase type 5
LATVAKSKSASRRVEYDRKSHFDFGITVGDNFTPDEMHSMSDPRWKSCWEDLYGLMGIRFYPTFGNHDWYHPDSPAAEILYSSSTWHMPSPYYTFTAGPVQFFAIDTEDISKAQVDWLTHALDTSQARWKVVYGHFPPYFASPYRTSSPEVVRTLMPILKGRADVYFAGHYHSLEHLKPVDGVNLFISGGGGRPTYPIDPNSPVALFAKQEFGFAVIETDEHTFTVRFIDKDRHQLYETTLKK